jgi:hypothetical protein
LYPPTRRDDGEASVAKRRRSVLARIFVVKWSGQFKNFALSSRARRSEKMRRTT